VTRERRRRSFLEENLTRIFRVHARRAAAAAVAPGAVEEAFSRCLVALRPRNRWPENTRAYDYIRSRLSGSPLTTLTALAAALSAVLYLGFGQAVLGWVQTLLQALDAAGTL